MRGALLFVILFIAGCQTNPEQPLHAARERSADALLQVADYPLGPLEDEQGHLWLGSVASGAMVWNGRELRYFHQEEGLLGNRVTGLTTDAEGRLWLVSAEEMLGGNSALMTWDGEHLTRASHPVGFPTNSTSPFFDDAGNMWLQSEGAFYRGVNGVFEAFPLPEPSFPKSNATGYEPMNMLQSQNGDFWFSTSDQGAYRWDGQSFHQLSMANGLLTNNVSLHLEDRQGNIWLSCFHWHLPEGEHPGGLCMWDGSKVVTFPDVPGLNANEIYSVFEDREGGIWIAATGHCVYRFDGRTFHAFRDFESNRPDFSFGCNSIYQDSKDRMWFGFVGGLYRLDCDAFVNVTRGGPWD
jgi:ligand-binding sensor domain-containing protein